MRPGRARAQGGPAETDNTTRKTQSATRLTCRSGSGPKGGIVMSERNTERKEKDWTDEIPDEEDSLPEPYEETYRDGSAKNECWGEQ